MNAIFQRIIVVFIIALACVSFGSAVNQAVTYDGGGGGGSGDPSSPSGYGYVWPDVSPPPRSGLTGNCYAAASCGSDLPVFKIEFLTGSSRIEPLSQNYLSLPYKVCCPVSTNVVACESQNWPSPAHLCGGYNIGVNNLHKDLWSPGNPATTSGDYGRQMMDLLSNYYKGFTMVFGQPTAEYYRHEGIPFYFAQYIDNGGTCGANYYCVIKITTGLFASCATTNPAGSNFVSICMQKAVAVPRPGTISLSAPSSTSNSVTLTWTAPNNGTAGSTVKGYKIVRSQIGIIDTDDKFNAAELSYWPHIVAPPVLPPGSPQTVTVPYLSPGTTYWFAIKALGNSGDPNWYMGLLSNSPSKATTGPDTVAPGVVTSFATPAFTSNAVTLTWTATGDDGAVGTATTYDVRYSRSTITSANWDNAAIVTQVSGEPVPRAAGTAGETVTVAGLSPGTTYYFAMKVADEVPNWGGMSAVISKVTAPASDTIAPETVSDLAASSPTQSSMTLGWSAPGNDGAVGTAASYDIRYSTASITQANFGSASQVSGEPAPAAHGTAQWYTVTGLNANTPYYFSIKAVDAAGNWNQASNSPSGTTSPAPPVCPPEDMIVAYDYSDRNWVKEIKVQSIVQDGIEKTFRENYLYDAVGNLQTLKDFEIKESDASNLVYKKTTFGYDNLNRLTGATGDPAADADGTPTSPIGRYVDNLAWAYDKVGNIKSNYELTYCYAQAGGTVICDGSVPCACSSNIGDVANNRLLRVKASTSGFDTNFGYDPYGNMCYESGWSEVPVGAISTNHGVSPNTGPRLLFADDPGSTTLSVLYYHNTNSLFTAVGGENMAWSGQTVSPYSGTESPYWDGTPTYSKYVALTVAGTGTLTDQNDFLDADLNAANENKPFIKQYFRAYKGTQTYYKWDYANRLISSWECAGLNALKSCMAFSYDHAGNRISKTTCNSVGATTGVCTANQAHKTVYITQGNNVIFEDNTDLASWTCPYYSCPAASACQ